jgi:hypothetical protein
MLYNVTFRSGNVYCANLVEADDIDTARDWFIKVKLKGDSTRFIGILINNEGYRPDKPRHRVPDGWSQNE